MSNPIKTIAVPAELKVGDTILSSTLHGPSWWLADPLPTVTEVKGPYPSTEHEPGDSCDKRCQEYEIYGTYDFLLVTKECDVLTIKPRDE